HRPDRGDDDDLVFVVGHFLDRLASRDAGLEHLGIVQSTPDFVLRHGDKLLAGHFHGVFLYAEVYCSARPRLKYRSPCVSARQSLCCPRPRPRRRRWRRGGRRGRRGPPPPSPREKPPIRSGASSRASSARPSKRHSSSRIAAARAAWSARSWSPSPRPT